MDQILFCSIFNYCCLALSNKARPPLLSRYQGEGEDSMLCEVDAGKDTSRLEQVYV